MSNINSDSDVNLLLLSQIDESDTIKDFMEKCNNNFTVISEWGGGPKGVKGEQGSQGVPTKPKVPIHAWKKGDDYDKENYYDGIYTINTWYNDLSDDIYQDGHLIILENGHVYILKLELDNNTKLLKPNYIISIQTYDPGTIVNGKNAYVHFTYADSMDSITKTRQDDLILDNLIPDNLDELDQDNLPGFITDQEIREIREILKRNINNENNEALQLLIDKKLQLLIDKKYKYIGVYSDNEIESSIVPYSYTWIKIKDSKIYLELTKDNIIVPSSIYGNSVHPEYGTDINGSKYIESQMILYNENGQLDYNNITECEFEIINSNDSENSEINNNIIRGNTNSIFNGIFYIPTSIIKGDIDIKCSAIYNDTKYSKILSIHLKETPYELVLNKNTLFRNNNGIINGDLKACVKYWMNGEWKYTKDGDVKATIKYLDESNSDSDSDFIEVEDYTFEISPDNDNYIRELKIDKIDTKNIDDIYDIIISLSIGDSKEILSKTINIVDSGEDGTSITITSLEQKDGYGETSTITFSDGNKLEIKNGNDKSIDFDEITNQITNKLNIYPINNGIKIGNDNGITISDSGINSEYGSINISDNGIVIQSKNKKYGIRIYDDGLYIKSGSDWVGFDFDLSTSESDSD